MFLISSDEGLKGPPVFACDRNRVFRRQEIVFCYLLFPLCTRVTGVVLCLPEGGKHAGVMVCFEVQVCGTQLIFLT